MKQIKTYINEKLHVTKGMHFYVDKLNANELLDYASDILQKPINEDVFDTLIKYYLPDKKDFKSIVFESVINNDKEISYCDKQILQFARNKNGFQQFIKYYCVEDSQHGYMFNYINTDVLNNGGQISELESYRYGIITTSENGNIKIVNIFSVK